jgi:hypothetical protein
MRERACSGALTLVAHADGVIAVTNGPADPERSSGADLVSIWSGQATQPPPRIPSRPVTLMGDASAAGGASVTVAYRPPG